MTVDSAINTRHPYQMPKNRSLSTFQSNFGWNAFSSHMVMITCLTVASNWTAVKSLRIHRFSCGLNGLQSWNSFCTLTNRVDTWVIAHLVGVYLKLRARGLKSQMIQVEVSAFLESSSGFQVQSSEMSRCKDCVKHFDALLQQLLCFDWYISVYLHSKIVYSPCLFSRRSFSL